MTEAYLTDRPNASLWKRFFLICCIISVITGAIFFFIYAQHPGWKNLMIFILTAASYTFPIAFANGWLNDFLDRKYSWTEDTRRRLLWGITVTLLVNAFVVLGRNYLDFVVIQGLAPQKFFPGKVGRYHLAVLAVALFVSVILHARGFFLEWRLSAKRQVREQKIIARSASAQFESLKNQLDPHFLFNSLNVLDALIEENPRQAQHFTQGMSKVYRYVLEQKDKELVTVAEELDFARTYAELLKTRFEDSVTFSFEVPAQVLPQFVVPLSLQLLLENAIKHNHATAEQPLHIRVYAAGSQLIVENNLQAREQVAERAGIGLANIVQRYALLTKDSVIIDESAQYFKIKLPILTEKFIPVESEVPNQMSYERAAQRVAELKKFYTFLAVFVIVTVTLVAIRFFKNADSYDFLWLITVWAFLLLIRAFRLFGFGAKWENRKINELMNKNNL